VPCIIHCCSSATVAVTVGPGAAVYRERKEYYRCRIGISKLTAEQKVHYFETELLSKKFIILTQKLWILVKVVT